MKLVARLKAVPFAVGLLAALAAAATIALLAFHSPPQPADEFRVPADVARIFIYRSETFGAAAPITVVVDGRPMATTLARTYLAIDVAPGTHRIESNGEDVAKLMLNVRAGQAYYVWQEVKAGRWSARSVLHTVTARQGMRCIRECRRLPPGS